MVSIIPRVDLLESTEINSFCILLLFGLDTLSIYHPLPRLLNNDIPACYVQGCFFIKRVLLGCFLWIHSGSNGPAYSVNVTSFAGAKQFLLELGFTPTKHLSLSAARYVSCDARMWVWLGLHCISIDLYACAKISITATAV